MVVNIGHIMDLGMAIVAGRNAICCLCRKNLIGFCLAIGPSLFLEPGLQESTTTATAEIIRPIGGHVYKIFFSNHGPDHISQLFGNRITKGFSYQLTGILNRKLDLTLPVPV
jgi:hypothetical protein